MGRLTERPAIVVVGAGPAGLLFATDLSAAEPGLDIHVVDARAAVAWRRDSVDPRVYALSRASERRLGGLWATVRERRASAYSRMHVFEGPAPGGARSITFDAADVGEPDLGHIVEDSLLRTVLLDRLAGSTVDLRTGAGVASIERREAGVVVRLDDGATLKADLVVGADGANSHVRSELGFATVARDYRQSAVVTHVETEVPHAATAWQRFLPSGPLAFLPLADGRSSVVWTQPAADAERVRQLSDVEFIETLEGASGGLLGRLSVPTARYAFPLRLLHSIRYTAPGVALIGDAAHTVHPLAGQGMNLGLGDAAVLATTIAAAVKRGEWPADEAVLRRYDRAQKAHNVAMQLAFDALNALFSRPETGFLARLRGAGLGFVDRLHPAKRLLISRALGLDRQPSTPHTGSREPTTEA